MGKRCLNAQLATVKIRLQFQLKKPLSLQKATFPLNLSTQSGYVRQNLGQTIAFNFVGAHNQQEVLRPCGYWPRHLH